MGSINIGSYDHLLRRTTAQVGPGSKVGNALEDLFPTLDVEQAPMEILRARGWKFGQTVLSVTPAVGTIATVQLFNPVDSSHLAVVTKAILSVSSANPVNFGPSFTPLASSASQGAERDTRAGVITQTVCSMQEEDDGGASLFGTVIASATESVQLDDSNGLAVLAPGTGYRFSVANVSIGLTIMMFWRERVAEPEELDF